MALIKSKSSLFSPSSPSVFLSFCYTKQHNAAWPLVVLYGYSILGNFLH